MNDLRTAAQQALDWLYDNDILHPTKVSEDLRTALAQEKAEPVEPVATLTAQRDALLEALRALVRNEGLDAYSYLDKGIGTATAAGQRWLNARAAIKMVEEGK